jgi:murein DD-endopeptidase MepM/ murein hydrolase activator NlpD
MDSNNAGRKTVINSVIYIILALCVVAIMCMAVFTIANTGNKDGGNANTGRDSANTAAESGALNNRVADTTANKFVSKPETTAGTYSPANPASNADSGALEPIQEPVDLPVTEEVDVIEIVEEVEEETEPVIAAPQAEPVVYIMPTQGYVTKGNDEDLLVYSLTMNDYRVHKGIDVSATLGAPVFACSDGTVESVYDDAFMGKCIVIDHGDGLKSYYMNLGEELPEIAAVGAKVETGDIIATVGESAQAEIADTYHLHFAMTVDDINVDPLSYIPYDSETISYAE